MTDNSIKEVYTLADAAGITYFKKDNIRFAKNSDFISAEIKKTNEEGIEEWEKHERVWLHRSFPFDMPDRFISVQNKDSEELGLIKDISDLDAESAYLVRGELERKYYTPKVLKILTLKETRGFSFWKINSDAGELTFTLQDTHKSISRVGEDRAFIFDICGNRYEIPSISALDKNSLRKLELYL